MKKKKRKHGEGLKREKKNGFDVWFHQERENGEDNVTGDRVKE